MLIAYVGQFRTDVDSAGLQRVLGIAAGLAASGSEVFIGGQGPSGPRSTLHSRVTLEGYGYVREGRSRVARLAAAYGVEQWLERLARRPDLVVVYGGTGRFTQVVRKWARRHVVPRVVDSVEWYDPRHQPGGRLGIKAIDNELSMRHRFPAYDGAIAISRYLERHYLSHETRVIRVPPVTDVQAMRPAKDVGTGPLRLAYAGSPGRKDHLGTIVRALTQVDANGQRICLDVVGLDTEHVMALPGMPDTIPASLVAHGRKSRAEALDIVARADYVPLLRPDERFAHAGFPTKVVEAMSVGTPVIANHTSDLELYVRHGDTGLQVPDDSVAAVAETLEQAVREGREMARHLGVNARAEALESFDYRSYVQKMAGFAQALI